jgi:hypothetical protein
MQLRSFIGTTAALTMTAVVGLGMASPALAADPYGPKSGSCHVSATNVKRGGTITVTGNGFKPRSIVTLTVSQGHRIYITKNARAAGGAGVAFGQAASATPGSVRFRVKLTRSGTNTIKLIGTQFDGTGTLVLTSPRVFVRGGSTGANAATGDPASGLPGTGGVNFTPLWAGLGLLAAGALLVSVAHSRRRILV